MESQNFVRGQFEFGVHVGCYFVRKFDEVGANVEKMLYAKKTSK